MDLTGKRILVTGGAGFLGTHVVDLLRELSPHSIHVPRRTECDLTLAADTQRLFRHISPDVVFHLAAQVGGIGTNQRNPGLFFHDNMLMGVNVLEQARLAMTSKVVLVGTVCSYPKFAKVPFSEDDLWNGYPEETNAPYGIAKRAIFTMAQAYREQYGLNSICMLPVNLYGPRDNFDLETSHVVPAMIRKFVEAQARRDDKVVLWGDGEATREFLYVADCARALVLAAEQHESDDVVNIGTGKEIRIRDLATLLARVTGFQGEIVWDATRPNGQPRRQLDTTRAYERFGFRAAMTLDEGLTRTVAWYKNVSKQPGWEK